MAPPKTAPPPLEAAARSALAAYPLRPVRITPLSARVHATFRIDADGEGAFVLRLYRPEVYSTEEIRSELAWLEALRGEGLLVPEPVRTRDGARLSRAAPRDGNGAWRAALSRWMPGRVPQEVPDAATYRRFGEFMGRLHRHGSRFRPRGGFARPRYDLDRLLGAPGQAAFAGVDPALLTAADRRTLSEAAALLRPVLEGLGEDSEDFGLIHGDLQLSNQLLHAGEVGALDFVDCGWGYFLYDIAGALLPAWEGPDAEERRQAFLRGYRRVRPLRPARLELLETFAVVRGLSVLRFSLENWDDPAVREPSERLVPHLKAQIRRFLAERGGDASVSGVPESVSELLAHLRDRGIRLFCEDGRLRYRAAKGALTPDLRARLAARKDELLAFLQPAAGASDAGAPPLVSVPRTSTLPTSFAQQRMWILDQIDPQSPAYHIAQTARIGGALRPEVLHRGLGEIVDRHEILRTTFTVVDREPRQRIAPATSEPALPRIDLRALAGERREAVARGLANDEAVRPFDLAAGPLARFTLVTLTDEESWLLMTLHHIVSDGWSNAVLIRELTALYRAFAAGRPSPLADLPLQYADFACWQRRWLRGAAFEEQLAYWKEQLAGAPSRLELPTDRPRPRLSNGRAGELPLVFSPAAARAIEDCGKRRQATLFMSLLAALMIVLHRHTGQRDIVVGSPIANRNRIEIEGLIGFFVNTLALRARVLSSATFEELLAAVRSTTLGAYAHQDLPFEKLVDALAVERNPGYTPIFQVLFTLQNAPLPEIELPGLTLSFLDPPRKAVAFDLTVTVRPGEEALQGTVAYSLALFDDTRIRRLARHLEHVLTAAAADPRRRLSDLPLLSAAERQQLLAEWPDPFGIPPLPALVHARFASRAAQTPEAAAVVSGTEVLTYAHLQLRSERLAGSLRSLGVGAEDRVGVDAERSVDLVVALLGILRAGAAYVPLERALPGRRLAFLCRDAGISVIVTRQGDRWGAIPALRALDPRSAPGGRPQQSRGGAASLAYVVYTSGSTGRPKGVMVAHGSLGSYAEDAGRHFALTARDRVLQFASLSFDTSAEEIYPTLIRGATLVLRDEEMLASPRRFLATLKTLKVTVLNLPTAYWHELAAALDAGQAHWPDPVRLVVIGGESARRDRLRMWHGSVPSSVRLLNTYGPTEATIVAARQWLTRERSPEVPIGRPVAHARAYLLDEDLESVPMGALGELYLGGLGLARGYLGRAGRTARAFLPHPFDRRAGERLYRTGDRAAWRARGVLGFRGRTDGQVKVRGFRVELQEIEAALLRHPAVAEAAVALDGGKAGAADPALVAYLATASREAPSVEELRRFLGRRLPGYMVPARYQVLESLPLTPSRKVDRQALSARRGTELALEAEFMAPRTPLEEELATIWLELLGRERVGVEDNFFDLGGNSLIATQLVSRVRSAFGVELALATFFAGPTVADLARSIEVTRRVIADAGPSKPAPSEERDEGEV